MLLLVVKDPELRYVELLKICIQWKLIAMRKLGPKIPRKPLLGELIHEMA